MLSFAAREADIVGLNVDLRRGVIDANRHFAMRKATEASQIYPVFRDLFKKEAQ